MTPVLVDANGEDVKQRSWLKEQLTLTNIVLACSIAFGVGGYIRSFQALEERVSAMETSLSDDRRAAVNAIVRQAVQDETLQAIKEQLAEIRSDVKELKARR